MRGCSRERGNGRRGGSDMLNFGVYSKLLCRLAGRNLIRHYAKSILSVMIGMLTIILLIIYAGNIASTNKQLLSLPEAMEVTGRISNLEGSQDTGLAILAESAAVLWSFHSLSVMEVLCIRRFRRSRM